MAVRTKDSTSDDAPVTSGGGGLGFLANPVIVMLALVGIGFFANNYLISQQVTHDTTIEFRGYKDGVRDVR